MESNTVATLYPQPAGYGAALHMPQEMLQTLGLRAGSSVTMYVARRRVPIRVEALPSGSPGGAVDRRKRLYVPADLMRKISLPAGLTIMVRHDRTGELHVGP